MDLYDDFEAWINNVFDNDIPTEVVAINFNIYEDVDNKWSIEPVGTSSFDEDDEDWACDEVTTFNTRDNPFTWQEETSWEEVLFKVKDLISKYLVTGNHSYKLKGMKALACGFVDGDIEVLYQNS